VREGSSLHLNPAENAVDKPSVSVLLEHGTPSILVDIERMSCLILDTGSVSIIQPGISGHDVMVMGMKPYGVTGEVLDIKGQESVSFEINGRQFEHTFLVCSLPTEAAGLLGTNFMAKAGAVIDFECGSMALMGIPNVSPVYNVTLTGHTRLTVFMEGKEGHSLQPTQQEARCMDAQLPANPQHEVQAKQMECGKSGLLRILS